MFKILSVLLVHLLPYCFTFIQVPCNFASICPNASTEFICEVQDIGYLNWIVPKINSNEEWKLTIVPINPDFHNSTMGIYSASLIEGDATYVSSKLSFIGPTEVNNDNMEIICTRGSGNSDGDRMKCPFIIEDKPSSPINLTVIAIDTDTVNLSWSSPLSGNYCIDYYIVSVSNGSTVQNHTTNLTIIVINGLEQGLSYSFSVIAVDYGGREGTINETVTLIMDVPGQVNSLNYSVSIVDGTYYLSNVNWDEGDNILKPPVIHYNIYHNFTSSNFFETKETNVTFHNVSCGAVYVVKVNAENIVGKGENRSVIIIEKDLECLKSCNNCNSTELGTYSVITSTTVTIYTKSMQIKTSLVSKGKILEASAGTSSVSHTSNSVIYPASSILQVSSSESTILVPVGVISGILFVILIFAFIIITLAVVRKNLKAHSKLNCYDENQISLELSTINEQPPQIPPYNPSAPEFSESSAANQKHEPMAEAQLCDKANGMQQQDEIHMIRQAMPISSQYLEIELGQSHSRVHDDSNGTYSLLQRQKKHMIEQLMPTSSDYSQINLEQKSKPMLTTQQRDDVSTEYSKLHHDRKHIGQIMPASSDYSQIKVDQVKTVVSDKHSKVKLDQETHIMYAELGDFSHLKKPVVPPPSETVTYSTLSKLKAPPIPKKPKKSGNENDSGTTALSSVIIPPPVPKKLSENKSANSDIPPSVPARKDNA